MKNKTYILGLITTLLVFLGILFKIQHWPGAGYLLILGIFMLIFIFLPVALMSNYKAQGTKENKVLYIVTWITCFVVFTAMLFKVQHWPGAGYGLMIALPFPYVVFLPVFLFITAKDKNFNIYNTVAVLFLLALISAFSAMLAISVSKERILDSLAICTNYNRINKDYEKLPVSDVSLPVIQKADEALNLVNEYKEIIFRREGITGEQWANNPEIIMKPVSRKALKTRTFTGREGQVHGELQETLSEMISLLQKDPLNKPLADNITAILNMVPSRNEGFIFADPLFKSDVRPWVHAYLDGLEANLKLVKATI